jgi:hypothetical protein
MLHVVVDQDALFKKELFELDKHSSFFQTVRFLRFLLHLVELLEVCIQKLIVNNNKIMEKDDQEKPKHAKLHPDSREFREILERIMPPTFYHIRDPSFF